MLLGILERKYQQNQLRNLEMDILALFLGTNLSASHFLLLGLGMKLVYILVTGVFSANN